MFEENIFDRPLLSLKIDCNKPVSAPYSAAFDWNTFSKYMSNSNFYFHEINNTSDIDSCTISLRKSVNNSQKHAAFHKFKNKTTFALHY